jgi:hypothetical protein
MVSTLTTLVSVSRPVVPAGPLGEPRLVGAGTP